MAKKHARTAQTETQPYTHNELVREFAILPRTTSAYAGQFALLQQT